MTVHDLFAYLNNEIKSMKESLELMRGHVKNQQTLSHFEFLIIQKEQERDMIKHIISLKCHCVCCPYGITPYCIETEVEND